MHVVRMLRLQTRAPHPRERRLTNRDTPGAELDVSLVSAQPRRHDNLVDAKQLESGDLRLTLPFCL